MSYSALRRPRMCYETKVWTENETDYLYESWGKRSARQIGKSLGRTRNSIIGKARRQGLSKSQSPTPQQEHARHKHLARSPDSRPVDIANRDEAGRRVLEKERMK